MSESREADIRRLEAAIISHMDDGESDVRCDRCNGLIKVVMDRTRTDTRCPCGKFNDTLRGL